MFLLRTKDLCMLPRDVEFQDRSFVPNKVIPALSANQLNTETELILGREYTKDPRGQHLYEFRDGGNVTPLLFPWQQPDYRPLYFSKDTRNEVRTQPYVTSRI